MEVHDELVEETVAAKANGSTPGKRAELSSGAAHVRFDRARTRARGSSTASAACSRGPGTGERKVPGRARHTMAGGFAAGRAVCASHVSAETGIHVDSATDPGARHRGHNRNVCRNP